MSLPARWRKSSRSKETQDCVEIDMDDPSVEKVGVRDSKNPDGELRVSREAFVAFVARIKQT